MPVAHKEYGKDALRSLPSPPPSPNSPSLWVSIRSEVLNGLCHEGVSKSRNEFNPKVLFYKGLGDSLPKRHVREHISQIVSAGQTDCFHVLDVSQASAQCAWWHSTFENIRPFYAVKSNNSMPLLTVLAEKGFGFDCASRAEMEQVLSLGVSPDRIVFSNPCKLESAMTFAKLNGVNSTVFDSVTELEKIARYHPATDVMMRIYAKDPTAKIALAEKAGALPRHWDELLQTAKRLNLNLRGVMFHVGTGSGSDNSGIYDKAIQDCKELFQRAEKMGFHMDHIDIGGGQSEAFGQQVASVVHKWMKQFPRNVSWSGEPGRSISKPTQTVCCRVIGLREGSVTLNDGVHGSFSGVMQEKSELNTETPTDVSGSSYGNIVSRTLFGPTCDGLDELSKALPVPEDIKVGDWLVFASMGAYSQVTRSQFNGMPGSTEVVLGSIGDRLKASTFGAFSTKLPVKGKESLKKWRLPGVTLSSCQQKMFTL